MALCILALMAPAGNAAQAEAEEIIALNFDDGGLDGFETYIEGGACELSNEDGQLAVLITSCGSLDYANQVYRDGFSLVREGRYQFSFDISCDTERTLDYRFQLNGGDYHAYAWEHIAAGPQTQHISLDFTMEEETDPAPRLAFNMGFSSEMAEDPGTHTVLIDNICLTLMDGSGMAEEAGEGALTDPLRTSQVGYLPDNSKTAFWILQKEAAVSFRVENEAGEAVFEGNWEEPLSDPSSGFMIQHGDFTPLREPGLYHIVTEDGGAEFTGEPFVVGEDAFDSLRRSVFYMLYLQRCGVETVSEEEALQPFLHGVCHSTPALIYGTDRTKDVSGGWHDAGDYGRYVVSGAKAVADLFQAYAWSAREDDDLGIPESGNGISDLLDEARFELDWMLKMQDEQTGGVYHKVTCRTFPGAVIPEAETDELVLSPISVTATADFAAVMAKASVIWRDLDPEFAQTALHGALSAWNYVKDRDVEDGFRNPPEILTGEYPDLYAGDELFWAAAELYLAGELDLPEVIARYGKCGGADLGWENMSGYGLYDLVLSGRTGEEEREKMAALLTDAAAQIAADAGTDGFFTGLYSYPWGSNMVVANRGMLLLMAASLTDSAQYRQLAMKQRDYLLGANPTGYCYVTGTGTKSVQHPHHRPSQAAGEVMPGMLAGGPDNALEDPYAQSVLQGCAPALCYTDNEQSYSTNEVTVYWNSPLIALLSGDGERILQDVSGSM